MHIDQLMVSMLRLSLILSAAYLILAVQPAWTQGTLTTATDKVQYAYSEVMEISVTISNPTEEMFHLMGSSTCQAQFRFDGFDSHAHTICTLDLLRIEFPPGSNRTWIWKVDPEELGLPMLSGSHTIVGYYPGSELADTVNIEAPQFRGGRVAVGLREDVPAEQIEAIKDSLEVQVIERSEFPDGASEIWQIAGITIDSAEARYSKDARFRYLEAIRQIGYHQIVSAEDMPGVIATAALTPAYPNPFTDSFVFGLELSRTQYVHVTIYDVLGREVDVLHAGVLTGPSHQTFSFDAGALANGLYMYRAEGEFFSLSGKVLLAR